MVEHEQTSHQMVYLYIYSLLVSGGSLVYCRLTYKSMDDISHILVNITQFYDRT